VTPCNLVGNNNIKENPIAPIFKVEDADSETLPTMKKVQLSQGVLISPYPDLLPDVFCLMVRIFRLMLVLLYI